MEAIARHSCVAGSNFSADIRPVDPSNPPTWGNNEPRSKESAQKLIFLEAYSIDEIIQNGDTQGRSARLHVRSWKPLIQIWLIEINCAHS
jgi:hypothetical protein